MRLAIDAGFEGAAFADVHRQPHDRIVLGLPVHLGQHRVGFGIGEEAAALDRRKLRRVSQHEQRDAERQQVAAKLGIPEDAVLAYGPNKAKVSMDYIASLRGNERGKLVLVTAMTPTPAGEGKTTTSVALTMGLGQVGKSVMLCLREPSMGPVFGVKGGGTGGGYAQIVRLEGALGQFTDITQSVTSIAPKEGDVFRCTATGNTIDGAALESGAARVSDADIVLVLDADLGVTASQGASLLAPLVAGPAPEADEDVGSQPGDDEDRRGRIDLYKRGCFVLEAKQSREGLGAKSLAAEGPMLPGLLPDEAGAAPRSRQWDVLMRRAREQAEQYARALPVEHGCPPFLIVVDVGRVIELFADFSGQGKHYKQFPDRARFRITLDCLTPARKTAVKISL